VFRTDRCWRRRQQDHHETSGSGSSDVKVTDRSLIWNSDLIETLEFDNLIARRLVTMESAPTARKAAAPTRARTSRTATTTNWMKHTLAWADDAKKAGDARRPPGAHLHDDQRDQYIEPKARVY
jgi:succinate dehydrogenase/fumarate reductase flavoprotein subunit